MESYKTMTVKHTPAIWEGRVDDPNDASTFRFHQIVQPVDVNVTLEKKGVSIIGYACDEGVKRNNGRPGAIQGPSQIRKALGSMAYHGQQAIHDFGDYRCLNEDMEGTQKAYAAVVCQALEAGQLVIGLGGGHDIAYGSYRGIKDHLQQIDPKARLGILNIDSHLDLRTPDVKPHSGSPFHQIAQEELERFSYCCFGIQGYGNTQKLLQKAKDLNVQMIFRGEIRKDLMASVSKVAKFVSGIDYLYLTVDLDAMDQSLCPGVSAPSVDGLLMAELSAVLDITINSKKLVLVDIAENCPKFDEGSKTSRTAAYVVQKLINGMSEG